MKPKESKDESDDSVESVERLRLIDLRAKNQAGNMLDVVPIEDKFLFQEIEKLRIGDRIEVPLIDGVDDGPTEVAMPKSIGKHSGESRIGRRSDDRGKLFPRVGLIANQFRWQIYFREGSHMPIGKQLVPRLERNRKKWLSTIGIRRNRTRNRQGQGVALKHRR